MTTHSRQSADFGAKMVTHMLALPVGIAKRTLNGMVKTANAKVSVIQTSDYFCTPASNSQTDESRI